ncbi:serine hydrolase domain-containing protein [Nocardia sp. NPDC052566]|uniref:serine hydrolase domain-containing protein n=1 Tax=Nocardia sp. NPDC052566 TaxID=3364330 RepID=UPI0037C5E818
MNATVPDIEHWRARLADIATRHAIPGVVLAISHGDELIEVAHGVLNVNTGVETTADSLFHLGSITKVWTATLAMRLVEQGMIGLDTPLREVLPELRLADPATAERITLRHLLIHTGGLDDPVIDTGRGDDCLARFVTALADSEPAHPLGETWAYSNGGFCLAGRVIEVLTGQTWDAAMRDMLFEPLGLGHTVTLPEDALLHRAAVGHMPGADGTPQRVDSWLFRPRYVAPAGYISASARDVLTFARMHLDGGVAPSGERLLSAESVALMQSEQVVLPYSGWTADSWGIGWWRADWRGERVIGHGGATLGQSAQLWVLPGHRLSFVVLTNTGDDIGTAVQELSAEIAQALAGVTAPRPFGPPETPAEVEMTGHLGVYQAPLYRAEVTAGPDGPRLRQTLLGVAAELMPDPVQEYALVPLDANRFAAQEIKSGRWMPGAFEELSDGWYLSCGGGIAHKIESGVA